MLNECQNKCLKCKILMNVKWMIKWMLEMLNI